MHSRGALRLAAACCAVALSSAAVLGTPPPAAGNATQAAHAPRFDVQEVSTQLFLDIAGALRSPRLLARVEGFRSRSRPRCRVARRFADRCLCGAVIMLVCRFVGLVFKGAPCAAHVLELR